MNQIKLIASDLDGTLLLNGNTTVDDNTLGMIEELIKNGVVFVAASGRQYENLQKLFYPVKDSIAYICYNGCYSIYKGEVFYKRFLDGSLAKKIVHDINEADDCDAMVSVAGAECICPQKTDLADTLKNKVLAQYRIVPDLTNMNEEVYKIGVYSEKGNINSDYWKEKYGEICTVQDSGTQWLDIVPKGINKGIALNKLLSDLNISPDNCIAFGDNENDIEMLKTVGYPITMQSASPKIQKYGIYSTNTVADSLLKLLQRA